MESHLPTKKHSHTKLGQAAATAICGNDILSSCLYVSGIAILFAGIFAPFVFLGIALVLYLYKMVYTEVVEALPVNGGAYNCLLNGTSKAVAAVAGVMTFLSYIATAVISSKVGMEYLHTVFPSIPVLSGTVVLLGLFALLVISGMKDSARVALGIFILHIATLVLFLTFGGLHAASGVANYFTQNFVRTLGIINTHQGLLHTLYLAFSASLLGVSGFESSANFVEEQGQGVFRKTLRNMLLGVAIFNPLIALVVLQSMPYDAIIASKDFLLADAARAVGGDWLATLVAIDAFLVLSGAVLTSFIGVSGLLSRMSADGCLPSLLSKQNKRGSHPRIVACFFILCSSILFITQGNLLSLAGVYTIAFLGVMSLFALGNIILKETRRDLKRTYSAPIAAVVIALLATVFGTIGNIRIDPNNLRFFEIYFIPTLLLVVCVIYQDYILLFLLRMTRDVSFVHRMIKRYFKDATQGTFVIFVSNIRRVFNILSYVNRNEIGRHIILVHCKNPGDPDAETKAREIEEGVPFLHKAGVFPHLDVKLIMKERQFSPELIDEVSKEFHVRRNRVMIGSIHNHHPFNYADLGGARIIF